MTSNLTLNHMSCSPLPIEPCFKDCMSYLSYEPIDSDNVFFGPLYSTVITGETTCFCSPYNVDNALMLDRKAFGPFSAGIASLEARTNTLDARFLFIDKTCEGEYVVSGGPAVLGVMKPPPSFDLWWVILIVCLFVCFGGCMFARFYCRANGQDGKAPPPAQTTNNNTPPTFQGESNGNFAQLHGSSGSRLFAAIATTPIGVGQTKNIPMATALLDTSDQDYETIPVATTVNKPTDDT